MDSYLFDAGWEREQRRLEALCTLYDAGTEQLLDRIGAKPGWRCLEAGAGTGTIARWLATRVGVDEPVIATDLDTRFLERAAIDGITIRQHDIVNDALEPDAFDLIHARALLMHLTERDRALDNMLRALRPGGTLLVEDVILSVAVTHPELPAWRKVIEAAIAAFQAVGADPDYGIKLPDVLRSRGFGEPGFEVRAPIAYSATSSADFHMLSIDQLRPLFVRLGLMQQSEIDDALGVLHAAGRVTLAPLMAACWITRPAS